MSIWQDYKLAQKIEEILRKDAGRYKPHHLGHPYMSAYQIALALKEAYPEIFKAIHMPLGGKDTKKHSSFSQYVGRQLSQHIKAGEMPNIEGGFLSITYIDKIEFSNGGDEIRSSVIGGNYPLSIFRWKGDAPKDFSIDS